MMEVFSKVFNFFAQRIWLLIVLVISFIISIIIISVLFTTPKSQPSQNISSTRYSNNITGNNNIVTFIDEFGSVITYNLESNTKQTINTVNNNLSPKLSSDGKKFIFSNNLSGVVGSFSVSDISFSGNINSGIIKSFTASEAYWINSEEIIYYTPSKSVINAGPTDFVVDDVDLFKININSKSAGVKVGTISTQEIITVTPDRILSRGPNDDEIKVFDISNNSIKEVFSKNNITYETFVNLKNNYVLLQEYNNRQLTLLNLTNGETQQLPSGYKINLVSYEDNSLIGLKDSSNGIEIYRYNIKSREEDKIMEYPKDITAPTNIYLYNNQLFTNTINGVFKFDVKK